MAIAGAVAAFVAVLAWLLDRRRMRRRDLDRVGFMPWTGIFFWALMAAILLIGLSGRAWLGG
ncbi:hypothetical protein [Novosphingobium mangrovi (ex Huang et al. 2023)]|uniref:Uncharacterized protein n=1 Tax=Novosphingobium mangrovi (ex Huang et al. 2023) TaxID=2976432 RepID=A0ABT2I3R4_9SPHN|nr:hypothetical protein [Novosphingobium mangrovi (ex Huang et al. 2023)]MCT2399430.1 hypothetical protein [Novosphingobium mangrovi (ex Huang et al. 2023)]